MDLVITIHMLGILPQEQVTSLVFYVSHSIVAQVYRTDISLIF
jgi:hypothetical protein